MDELEALAAEIGAALKARGEKIAVNESSSGGLISAALLSVPGASAYYLGGAVVYTPKARVLLTDIPREALEGMRSSSEPYALLLARNARERYGAAWGISETVITIETASDDRRANMRAFAAGALDLLNRALKA